MRALFVILALVLIAPSAEAIEKFEVDSTTAGPCGAGSRFYGLGQSITIRAADLPPNTSGTIDYRNELETVLLGTFSTDASGNLNVTAPIPGTITIPSMGALRGHFGGVTLISDLLAVGNSSHCNLPPLSSCPDWDEDGLCDNGQDGCPEFPGPTCPTGPECSDGFDNDHDGMTDFGGDPLTNDPGCSSAADASERDSSLACDDGIDNDGDGGSDVQFYRVNIPGVGVVLQRSDASDPACATPLSPKEDTQCDNDIDDDNDLAFDFDGNFGIHPKDPECAFASHDSELVPEPTGGLLAIASLLALGCLRRMR